MAAKRARPKGAKAQTNGATGETLRDAEQLHPEVIEQALATDDPQYRGLLESYYGEPLYEELRELAASVPERAVRGAPKVWILPGIMGSSLGYPRKILWNDVIWVEPASIARGRLRELRLGTATSNRIQALGLISLAYLPLRLRLRQKGLDAQDYPFDWRKSIDELGKQLVDDLEKESASQISLVAHSMGGLVARSALKHAKAGVSKKIQRLVMLGTPNHGSFSPVQVLRNEHSAVQWIGRIDLTSDTLTLINDVIRHFPSLYEMLPTPSVFSDVDLYNQQSWPLIEHFSTPKPVPALLKKALQTQQNLAEADERFLLVAGVEQNTIHRLVIDEGSFRYFSNPAGDGTVPLRFAQLDGMTTYYVIDGVHDRLPTYRVVADAVNDLVRSGSTPALPTEWTPRDRRLPEVEVDEAALLRAAPPLDEKRPVETLSPSERRNLLRGFVAPPSPEDLLEPVTKEPETGMDSTLVGVVISRKKQHRLEVRLALGSITDVKTSAYVLGLYQGVMPGGPAAAIDRILDGAITEMITHRMFPAGAGQVYVLPTGRHRSFADLIVFAGLGPFDQFEDNTQQMVAASVLRALSMSDVSDFATVLFGSNSGTSVRQSLTNLITGFFHVARDLPLHARLPAITLCEFDQNRFAEMKSELIRLASTDLFDDVEITLDELRLPAPEAERAARAGLTTWVAAEAVYLLVRQLEVEQANSDPKSLTFSASLLGVGGKGAVPSGEIEVDLATLDQHLARLPEVWHHGRLSVEEFGQELASLVLPFGIEQALRALRNYYLIVVHDATASRIPWETLPIGGHFPAADPGLSRVHLAQNLSVAKWLEQRRQDPTLRILLVVDPTLDLPGARFEGDRVRALFGGRSDVQLTVLQGKEATRPALLEEFNSGRYDVLHYAGHAFFDPHNRARSGLLCHNKVVLSGADLANLSRLPTLVFFNACESGRVRSVRGAVPGIEIPVDLAENTGLAESFLRGGVANYLGTYWPVGDAPAKVFSETFYTELIRGQTIGAALRLGREAVRAIPSHDWADYIHYGHPEFRLKLPER